MTAASTDPADPLSPRPRIALVDVARGLALIAMAVYHGTWDLSSYHLIALDPAADPGWRAFARVIASTFLVLVGVSLVLATRGGFRWRAYIRRFIIIAVAAGLVSLATYVLYPGAFIFFGILHVIAVSSVLALPFLRAPLSLVIGAALTVFLLPFFITAPVFNAAGWLWLGLQTALPYTLDYEPVLPWFAAVLAGIALARLVLGQGGRLRVLRWVPRDPVSRLLGFFGQHSLVFYLVHQPILLGLTFVAAQFVPPNLTGLEARFLGDCAASCQLGAEACASYCGCLASAGHDDPDFWADILEGRASEADLQELNRLAVFCTPG